MIHFLLIDKGDGTIRQRGSVECEELIPVVSDLRIEIIEESDPRRPEVAFDYRYYRRMAYPPVTDYLDALVKDDIEGIQDYINKCLDVKAKYPKPSN